MRLSLALAASVLLAFVAPGRAHAASWDFRTPSHAAYCRLEFARNVSGGLSVAHQDTGFGGVNARTFYAF